jgi:hypothetical protein
MCLRCVVCGEIFKCFTFYDAYGVKTMVIIEHDNVYAEPWAIAMKGLHMHYGLAREITEHSHTCRKLPMHVLKLL